jgi:chorismate--pyruvate lyase
MASKSGMSRAEGYDRAPMLMPPTPAPRDPNACRYVIDRSLRAWLRASGSLTARLRQHGTVTVAVQRQGRQRLTQQEQRTLRCRAGYVREVVLLVNGHAAVWARSSTSLAAVKGPWRAIKGLGTRPLAELLFSHQQVERSPLRTLRPLASSPLRCHMITQWRKANQTSSAIPAWARYSVFSHKGQALQVMEAFVPWVSSWHTEARCSPPRLPYT